MANIKSAKKRILITEKKTANNRRRKSVIKTYIKRFDNAIAEGNIDEAKVLLVNIDRLLKRAATKNIYHINNVSRKMSKLTRKLNNAM